MSPNDAWCGTLKAVVGELEARGVCCWLDMGTLLGAVRDGEFISTDNDMDLGTMARSRRGVELACQHLGMGGWKISRADADGGYGFRVSKNSSPIDIIVYQPRGEFNVLPAHGVTFMIPRHHFDNLMSIVICSKRYYAPGDIENYLALRYGENWRTPDPDWKTYESDPSIVRMVDETAEASV